MAEKLPYPYLDRDATKVRLRILGFTYDQPEDYLPIDTPEGRAKAGALEELIAGAIAEWVRVELDDESPTWDRIDNELREWAEEYLFG